MGNRIKELREAAGLSQSALAGLAGTTKNQLVKLENGSRRLSDHWANRLAPHLNVQAFELFMPATSKAGSFRLVPLVNTIFGGDWRGGVERSIAVVPAADGGPNVFALQAQDDSMDDLIQPSGYVFVDPDDCDMIDDKIYAMMDAESDTTANRYRANLARLVPCSRNPQHGDTLIGRD